jgi:hypothetical protein
MAGATPTLPHPDVDRLRLLSDRIAEQIRAAKKRQHARLVSVLIDCQCCVRHYRALLAKQECV